MNQALSELRLIDASGIAHTPFDGVPRIVSLVPSLTELVCDLGLAAGLAGRTGFCVHPRETVRMIPKVGGTKSVKVDRLRELAPTHVFVNVDENEKDAVAEISRFVPHVVVTHPLHPRDNVGLYRLIGGIFRRDAEAEALVERFENAWQQVLKEAAGFPAEHVVYLIWKKPWMTISRETYISAMLASVGWHTVPEAASARYPTVELAEILTADVRQVLLSSEPYRFQERDADELRRECPPHVRVSLIDGEMTSWYGSRAIEGLGYLAERRRELMHK